MAAKYYKKSRPPTSLTPKKQGKDMIEFFEATDCRRQLAQSIESGVCDERILSIISREKSFFPLECEILDYKQSFNNDPVSLGKTIRHIIAFHNTYGGYLVYGVQETVPEQEFQRVGCDPAQTDLKQLKDKIFSYVGKHIPISMWKSGPGSNDTIVIIFIPKRTEPEPVYFGKEGPQADGKFTFRKNDIYIRRGDNSEPATGPTLAFVFGTRECRYLNSAVEYLARKSQTLEHNLPDRTFICPRLIGRQTIIENLWSWLGDEFSYVRVLAGEGGLGKTSIAYEFSQQVCRHAPAGFERVLWVTAKKLQFIANLDQYHPVPETHYTSYRSLLEKICIESAISEEEIEGADEQLLKRFLSQALTTLPSLIVIDDVDSLEKNDQKRVLELAMHMGRSRSRFLLTTRINLTYSPDIAIEIRGLEEAEYPEYLKLLSERFGVPEPSSAELSAIYATTHGSPLFTESIYRLIKQGQLPRAAAEEWRGKKGVDARRAALHREISGLSPESKRVLYAASLLKSCSLAEIMEATQYAGETLESSLEELSSLFLLSAPRIAHEPRYEVLETVASLINQIKAELVPDHTKIETDIKRIRKNEIQKRRPTKNDLVGNAISEANALIRAERYDDAIQTVLAAQRRSKYHADLYLMQGRCLMLGTNANPDAARKAFEKAYKGGVRKPLLFGLWYRAETEVKHFVGAESVSNLALTQNHDKGQWLEKKAYALLNIAKDQERAGQKESCIKNLDSAAKTAWSALDILPRADHQPLKDALFEIDDHIIKCGKSLEPSVLSAFDMAQYALNMVARQDVRRRTLTVMVDFLELGAEQISDSDRRFSPDLFEILESLKSNMLAALDKKMAPRQGEEEFIAHLRNRILSV